MKGAVWFRKAATQGDAKGLLDLGQIYLTNRAVPQDYPAAFVMMSLAAKAGADGAASFRDRIAAQLTPVQLSAATATAATWRPGKPLPGSGN